MQPAQVSNQYRDLLSDPQRITDEDVLRFRREVFGDGIVSHTEACKLFALNDAVSDKSNKWIEFFLEAMTDYTVNQAEPRGYVSRQNAEWLVNRIAHDGVVESATELELLIRILAKARDCSSGLAAFALAQVAYAVVEGEGPLARGLQLTKGVIGEPEVELLRTVLYAMGGANGMSISRQEAEILFDINDRTDAEKNHPAWRDLFVSATGNYLMAAASYKAPSRAEALARKEWLEDTEEDVGGMLSGIFGGFRKVFSEGFFDDVFNSSHVQMEQAWGERNAELQAEADKNRQIDPEEASWLVDRIKRDGGMDANEAALLDFIRAESDRIDPSVMALMDKVA